MRTLSRAATMPPQEPRPAGEDPSSTPLLQPASPSPQDSSTTPPRKADTGDAPIVQFFAAILFGDKREGSLQVNILRLGEVSEPSTVGYFSEDLSAKVGITYEAVRGQVTFGPGERTQTFEVPLVVNHIWEGTQEFRLHLTNPENCELGQYLRSCRVKIIDDNIFPSNKYRAELESGQFDRLSMTSLFWEYCKWNFNASGVAKKTVLSIFMDQLANIYLLVSIRCDAYLVNVVCHKSEETDAQLLLPSRWWTAQLLCAVIIIPHALLHLWELLSMRLDVHGHSTSWLQQKLFRKYLNFSRASHEKFHVEHLQFAVLEEAQKLAGGYASVLDFLKTLGKVLVQFSFIAMKNPEAIWVIFAMALVMLAWVAFRSLCFETIGIRAQYASLSRHTEEICTKLDLISDYFLRPQANHTFAERSEKLREQTVKSHTQVMNTRFLLEWSSSLFMGIYVAFAVRSVIDGELQLGTFIVTISVIRHMGTACMHLSQVYVQIGLTFKQLQSVVTFLDMPTDLPMLKRAYGHRIAETKRVILDADRGPAGPINVDTIPIRCKGVVYRLPDGRELLKDVALEVPQGKIVALVGPHTSGKGAILSIIAHQLSPDSGEVFVPSYLRLLNVRRHAHILERSLLENLTFGCLKGRPPDLDRIKAILSALMLDRCVQELEAEVAGGDKQKGQMEWLNLMTYTEKNLLGLARALIMNPEVMILHDPITHFQSSLAEKVEELLLLHVRRRGLFLPDGSEALRGPRTVLYTTHSERCHIADIVLRMKAATATAAAANAGGLRASISSKDVAWTIG